MTCLLFIWKACQVKCWQSDICMRKMYHGTTGSEFSTVAMPLGKHSGYFKPDKEECIWQGLFLALSWSPLGTEGSDRQNQEISCSWLSRKSDTPGKHKGPCWGWLLAATPSIGKTHIGRRQNSLPWLTLLFPALHPPSQISVVYSISFVMW